MTAISTQIIFELLLDEAVSYRNGCNISAPILGNLK